MTWLFSNFKVHQNHLEGLLKHSLLSLTARVSDSVNLACASRICIFSKFPDDNDAVVQELSMDNLDFLALLSFSDSGVSHATLLQPVVPELG